MTEDAKRSEMICTKVTERMALDILHLASIEDRSVSEFIFLLVREKLYGASVRLPVRGEQSTK